MVLNARRLLVVVAGVAPALAFGWGAGHDTVARAVAARLPEPWRARLQGETLRQFCADSHYPDSIEPFPAERVGEKEVADLASAGVTKRYDLHSDKGRAVAFCMLTRALKEERPERALLWLAALSHSTADMAACNHDPVVHIATYGWCSPQWELRLPGGKALAALSAGLDLGWVQEEAFGRYPREALGDTGGGADAALLEIMLYGVRGVDACAPHGPLVLSAAAEWADTRTSEAGERLAAELSALGAWAEARVLRDFQVALRLAAAGQVPEVTAELLARYETEMDAFVKGRLLAADRFAREALTPSSVPGPRVGVLIEPCWRMNEGMFGFGDRVLAVQTVNTLRRRGRNAELVDVRDFLERDAAAPTLVVPAQRCGSYRTLKVETLDKRLEAFVQAGGKIVWVGGGKPPAALCREQPKGFMSKGEDKAWPVPVEAFAKGTLTVAGQAFSCENMPQSQAGWHWPQNPWRFSEEACARGRGLVAWGMAGSTLTVGLAWPKEKPVLAYVPGYALLPYVWTRETPLLAPLRLELDAAGTKVVEAALDALGSSRGQ